MTDYFPHLAFVVTFAVGAVFTAPELSAYWAYLVGGAIGGFGVPTVAALETDGSDDSD